MFTDYYKSIDLKSMSFFNTGSFLIDAPHPLFQTTLKHEKKKGFGPRDKPRMHCVI